MRCNYSFWPGSQAFLEVFNSHHHGFMFNSHYPGFIFNSFKNDSFSDRKPFLIVVFGDPRIPWFSGLQYYWNYDTNICSLLILLVYDMNISYRNDWLPRLKYCCFQMDWRQLLSAAKGLSRSPHISRYLCWGIEIRGNIGQMTLGWPWIWCHWHWMIRGRWISWLFAWDTRTKPTYGFIRFKHSWIGSKHVEDFLFPPRQFAF